jgi:Adenosylmethionine decarboxylase
MSIELSASFCDHCSESSMFISKNRFILKTCGRTTLLAAIKPLLKLVYEKCGFDMILVSSSLLIM